MRELFLKSQPRFEAQPSDSRGYRAFFCKTLAKSQPRFEAQPSDSRGYRAKIIKTSPREYIVKNKIEHIKIK